MKFASVLAILAAVSATVDCYPLILETSDSAMDKRDLHDFCGGWFCGHVKREEAPETTEANISTPSMLVTDGVAMEKRDLHDFCGGWFCGHVKRDHTVHDSQTTTSSLSSHQPNTFMTAQ
ncbi:hypothetical protein K493DRAFT_364243 [Basidiobolus meristosporus CBS 931.73]|uniref:Uncharacterized protein n=1 Tax=Basidiobolus meristosporus CBS 931.73 TaxID=1314790 RepID=A0A1Y1WJ68_9FUNG|nr:hypothetical protein K493DRAFT_364243 [Basidiobolus meristosporus CBS 931.73]|eukprot:ORX73533.1 hypothetical protein K493DRAFT_364243 [Basidiobolus meristosporus CBS 931.73]